jgi:RNA polymerase sigma factor (sigma-70 family)
MSDKTPFQYYSADLDATDIEHKSRKQLAELHNNATHGDGKSWEELWLYGTKLVLKICNKLRHEDLLAVEFEDAVAEGNLAIGEALTRWNPSKSSFGTWVWIRVRGSILNENASEQKSGMIGNVEDSPLVLSNEVHVEHVSGEESDFLLSDLYELGQVGTWGETEAQYAELYAAVQTLSPREQSYIVAVYFEDRDQAELAALEGISPRMVRKVLARSIEKLKVLLEGGSSSEDSSG